MDGEKVKLKVKRYNDLYMDLAERISKMSHAKRLQVGCILVKNDNILSYGWNGMPAGWDNNCEDILSGGETKTKPEVLHSEANCLMKVAKTTNSGLDATIYITHAPCLDCAKLIYQSGINSVFYRNSYKTDDGINFLEKTGVEVKQI